MTHLTQSPSVRRARLRSLALAGLLAAAALPNATASAQPAPGKTEPAPALPPPPAADAPPPAEPTEPSKADQPAQAAPPTPPPAEPELPEGHAPALVQTVEPKDHVRTGEVVKLKITADAKLGDDVTIADQSFTPFEVHKKQARVEPPNGDRQRFVFDLELLAFEPGDKPIPAIELRVVTKDNFVGTVKTQPVPFRVRGFLDNEPNAQPKLETKPVAVLQDNWIPIYILGGLAAAAVVALLTLLVSRYLRNRKRLPAPPPPPRPPWEIAVEELAALRRKRQSMIDGGQGALFVEQLNHVLRAYLGGRYAFDGLETTTDEMLAQLKLHGAGLGFTQEVGMFLGRCDLVKFAKVEPDADEVDLLFAKAQDLVQFSGPDDARGLTHEHEPEAPNANGPQTANPQRARADQPDRGVGSVDAVTAAAPSDASQAPADDGAAAPRLSGSAALRAQLGPSPAARASAVAQAPVSPKPSVSPATSSGAAQDAAPSDARGDTPTDRGSSA
jgi:BatD DUF11 like domain